ncbi:MAG: alpha/beta hydrolase [Chloroflexota bacterium]
MIGISDADADVLALPDVDNRLTSTIEEAFTQGHQSLSKEIAGFNLLEWEVKPSDVKAKTLYLYGSKDPVAAHRHGSWWQKQLPNARLEMSPKVGHLLIFPVWKRVLAHLLPQQRKKKK